MIKFPKDITCANLIVSIVCFLIVMIIVVLNPDKCFPAEISAEHGKNTQIFERIAHTREGEYYEIDRIGIIEDGWEVSIANHTGRDFNLHSIGFGYVWNFSYSLLYTDIGVGLRLTEKDRDNRWLCHKSLIADFSGSIGIKYKNFKAGYRLRHFSAPGDDPGMNTDAIFIQWEWRF